MIDWIRNAKTAAIISLVLIILTNGINFSLFNWGKVDKEELIQAQQNQELWERAARDNASKALELEQLNTKRLQELYAYNKKYQEYLKGLYNESEQNKAYLDQPVPDSITDRLRKYLSNDKARDSKGDTTTEQIGTNSSPSTTNREANK